MTQIRPTSNRSNTEAIVLSLSVDYRALLFRYRKNWYWFVLAVIACGVIGYLHLRYTDLRYATSATIIVEDPGKKGGLSERALGQQMGMASYYSIDDELNLIRSRDLMTEVVSKLGLELHVLHKGRIRDTEIYQPTQFSLRSIDSLNSPDIVPGATSLIGTEAHKLFLVCNKMDTVPYYMGSPFTIGNQSFVLVPTGDFVTDGEPFEYVFTLNRPQDVASGMIGHLSAAQLGKSNTVRLGYSAANPQLAADVVNGLISVYNQRTINQRSKKSNQTLAFLDERLAYVSRELYSVEASVVDLKMRENIIIDQASRGAGYLEQLNVSDEKVAELEVRKTLIEELRRTINGPEDEYRPLSVASEIIDGTLTLLIQRYNELIFERDQKLEVATLNNPAVITYTEKVRELRRSLRQSVETIYEETNERARRIKTRVQSIEAQMNRIPENERRLVQILRQKQIKENLFMYLMEKREEAALTVAAQIPNTRIIDVARPNSSPISPKPKQIYVLAFGLGLLLPAILIFLREAFNTRIQSGKDVERLTGATIVGRIAQSSKKQGIVVSQSNRSGVAEMFRLLRTNLSFLTSRYEKPVIMITSGVSGEGKTFISSNLGYSLALGNKKTVLVGTDMRRPQLGAVVRQDKGKAQSVGLSNYLIGQAKYEAILQKTDNKNLFLIESGPIPPNPSELLLQDGIRTLITQLKEDFDVVLIDTAPIGLVTDGLLLKDYIDLTLYVVRLGKTPKMSLEVLGELIEKDKMPGIGVVINGLQPKRDYGYGYAQGYYE